MTNQAGAEYPSAGGPPPLAQQTPRTNRLAVWSLVLALLFFVPLAPLVGLILGIIAIFKISASKGAMKGFGLAVAGVVVGGFFTLIIPALLLPALAAARDAARTIDCRHRLRSIGMSIQIYQADNNGQMPPSMEVLAKESYLKIGVGTYEVEHNSPVGETVLTCPSRRGDKLMGGDLDRTSSYCYAQPKDPRGISRRGTVPIMWEKAQSHRRGVNVLFADFQAQTEPLATLRDQIEQNSSLYVKPPVLPEGEKN